MTYLDLDRPREGGGYHEGIGRVILSGGEVLIDPVRETVLYPLLERLSAKYKSAGGVKIVVQTTGDLVSEKIIDELLERGIWMISVAGMDDFHVGMEGQKREPLKERLIGWFGKAGMTASGLAAQNRKWLEEPGPLYSFFGATPDAWIGKLWPRGRAWSNGLSTATIADNFCNRWSGGLNFLNHRFSGSEVAIDANGDVFPCCMKTKLPIGNLTEEPLIDILDSLVGNTVYEAINAGHPERMGLAHGWSLEDYYRRCETVTPKGKPYRNLCIGCDRFHEEVLAPVIAEIRAARRRQRELVAAE
ncbi:MAG: radical SAM/SPASM domain-containing protein [Hyphomicrobiaceae bacterium]|nr:MAG: radical SAM/SPASM domain-containing protein [Hyphomicrobiaceae bacterium]